MTEETDERISTKFDYEVECVPLVTADGTPTRFFGNRRKDTGEVFATVTDRYEILQNATLVESSEALFRSSGMGDFKRREIVTNGGARMRARYDFPNIGAKVDGQDLTFRLSVQNSFDGSLRASFQVGMVRLICSNGLAAPVNTLNLTRKHTSSLSTEFVGRALASAVESFHGAIPAFQRMAEIPVSMDEGRAALFNLATRKVMGERHAVAANEIWERPTYREDSKRNLWNLYNAVTQHLTHEVEAGGKSKPKFEVAERINTAVMQTFVQSARRGSINDLLIKLN